MIISKGILHILDSDSDLTVLSEKELDLSKSDVQEYLHKHLEKISKNYAYNEGTFNEDSTFRKMLQSYIVRETDFVSFSVKVAERLFETLSQSEDLPSADFLMCDYRDDEENYLCVMLLEKKEAFTHRVGNEGGVVQNEIIRHQAILPGTTQKIASCAVVNMKDLSISFTDKKRTLMGEDVFILPEKVLQCTTSVSAREAVKTIKKITRQVAEENGENSVEAISRVKNYFVENAEAAEDFSPQDIGDIIFEDSPLIKREFKEQLSECDFPQSIKFDREQAVRTNRSHKIKTDTGIEITFPVNYSNNTDFIEFINNPDGTISIEVKNIGQIINK